MPSRIKTQLPTEAVELEIIDLSHDGRGVARFKQKIIFVENALPGETVSARYTKKTRKFDEAITLKIISASKDRVEPICEYYNDCNGCSMMHLDQSRQIDFKFNALQVLLKKAVNVENINWLNPLTDKHLQYRRRAKLSVKWIKAKNKVLVGFRRVDGKHVTEMVGCHTLESGLSALIQPLSELFNSLVIKAFISQVECSLGDAAISLLIKHTRPFAAKDLCLIEHFSQDHGLQIFFQTKRSNSIKPIKNYTEPVYFKLSHSDLRFDFLPSDFIQVNKGMNDKMISQAIELLDLQSDDMVLDLFCGLGNFSLPMAKVVSAVIGIEGDSGLVDRASHNAKINNIDNALFYCADLNKSQTKSLWIDKSYSKILIDPPRSGAWDVLPLIAQTSANTLLYVSCNPASLARDAKRLVDEFDFRIVSAGVMDMFPHTSHVESMALFVRS